MNLPPTYFEFMASIRPELVSLAELDAAQLRHLGEISPVNSVDDYNSRFPKLVTATTYNMLGIEATSNDGLSDSELQTLFDQMPDQAKVALAKYNANLSLEYHSAVNFALFDKKVFHVSDNLSDSLLNTEINTKSELIKPPFPCSLMTYTSKASIDALYRLVDPGNQVVSKDYKAPISVFVTEMPVYAPLTGRKLVLSAWHARLPDKTYVAVKRELYLGSDWTLERSLNTEWKDLEHASSNTGLGFNAMGRDQGVATLDSDDFFTNSLQFFRLVLNTLLYLSSSDKEVRKCVSAHQAIEDKASSIKSPSRRRKELQSKKQYTAFDYSELGASVPPIQVRLGASSSDSDIPPRQPMKLGTQFIVRGHWRNQAHGEGMAKRKLIWVKPHLKGPDLGKTLNKNYIVG